MTDKDKTLDKLISVIYADLPKEYLAEELRNRIDELKANESRRKFIENSELFD